MPLPQRALPYRTAPFALSHEGRTFTFAMPADFDDVFDTIAEEHYEKDRFLPYWAEKWPSTAPFFSFLMNERLPGGARICELGCGLGVIAAALAAKGHEIIATDIAPEGCRFAFSNIAANGGAPRVVCADWRAMPFRKKFDLIVASDILYEERWIGPILDCIDTLLSRGGEAIIADPCRRFWVLFKRRAVERGFSLSIRERASIDSGKTEVEILSIRRA